MTDPQHATAAQAADPTTPLQVLADLAAQRPDLRAVVAANPAAYPALLEWLGSLGDPDVDSALRARVAGAGAVLTAGYGGAPSGGGPDPAGGFAPLGSTGRPEPEAAAPYLPVPRPAPYTQPDGVYYPPTSGPATTHGAPQPWMTTPPKSSNKALWIVLAVVGALIVGIVGLGIALAMTTSSSGVSLGLLRQACAEGDMQACDELFYESPFGSEDERFADTCGGRTSGGTYCVDEDFG